MNSDQYLISKFNFFKKNDNDKFKGLLEYSNYYIIGSKSGIKFLNKKNINKTKNFLEIKFVKDLLIKNNQLLVLVEKSKIYFYDLKDFKYIKTIKLGINNQFFINTHTIKSYKDILITSNNTEIIFYNMNGYAVLKKIIFENKIISLVIYKNYLFVNFNSSKTILIYDLNKNLKLIKKFKHSEYIYSICIFKDLLMISNINNSINFININNFTLIPWYLYNFNVSIRYLVDNDLVIGYDLNSNIYIYNFKNIFKIKNKFSKKNSIISKIGSKLNKNINLWGTKNKKWLKNKILNDYLNISSIFKPNNFKNDNSFSIFNISCKTKSKILSKSESLNSMSSFENKLEKNNSKMILNKDFIDHSKNNSFELKFLNEKYEKLECRLSKKLDNQYNKYSNKIDYLSSNLLIENKLKTKIKNLKNNNKNLLEKVKLLEEDKKNLNSKIIDLNLKIKSLKDDSFTVIENTKSNDIY